MPTSFLAPPENFVGREEAIARFKARLEHYNLFVYEGLPGIGKTALVRRLAKETKAVGVKESVFLALVPGEGINSISARIEARLRGKATLDAKGDPYTRFIEIMSTYKVVLVLDQLQNLRREDLAGFVRALRAAKGPFRVLATSRGDPELSAMDAMLMTLERVGPLNQDEVRKLCKDAKLNPQNTELLLADVVRGGASAQPLTLKFMLALCGNELPSKEFLDSQSARSINAFRSLLQLTEGKLSDAEKKVFAQLAVLGQPIARTVAIKVFGPAVQKLLTRGLLEEIDGDLYVHSLVGQYFPGGEISAKDAVQVALHLQERSTKRCEPLGVIRAGKLLAQAGKPDDAVETLAEGWEAVQSLGFLEAYLKILASIPHEGALGARLSLLSARARMKGGSIHSVREELERLSNERDAWTKVRALASLASVYAQLDEHAKVVATYESIKKLNAAPELVLPVSTLAAEAMLRLGKVADAEKLAKAQLARIKPGQEPQRQGELQRLLSQVYAQMGVLPRAVEAAGLAAKLFSQAGDLYNAAMAQGFIGDLYRETGDFELAQAAFREFLALAQKWGDKNLIQTAELTEAWVSLDVGDVTSAQKRVQAVEKELSNTAGRRLRLLLATARALLAAGRGHHAEAVELLPRIVGDWEQLGVQATSDNLRAQLVRSLIAVGKIDDASAIVDAALKRLDQKNAAFRVAAFLRESALIRLKRKDTKRALTELTQACKLFAQGGNRREEAHTLYRIAHAAFEDGDLVLAHERGTEALELARKIKHIRVVALSRELLGRLALLRDDVREAVAAAKEASSALKRLGDEIGGLHVNEALLRAQVVAGDLASAIKLGPKVSEAAEALEVREVRIRSIALTGVALLKRGRPDAAVRCFREIPDGAVSPATAALMWRLGESLAASGGEKKEALARRDRWVAALMRLQEHQRRLALHGLEQLGLPPRERYQLRTKSGTEVVGGEGVGFLDATKAQLYVDVTGPRVMASGRPVEVPSGELQKLLTQLCVAVPSSVPLTSLFKAVLGETADKVEEPELKPTKASKAKAAKAAKADKKLDTRLKALAKDLAKILKPTGADVEQKGTEIKLLLPKTYMLIIPTQLLAGELSGEQKKILKLVRKLGSAPLATIEEQLKVERLIAKREVDALVKGGLLESVRDGRGQAFRLA